VCKGARVSVKTAVHDLVGHGVDQPRVALDFLSDAMRALAALETR
jgi:hypothetical protein